MSKFIITATDRNTGARLYGRLDTASNRIAFRTGYAFADTAARRLGLHTDPAGATQFDIEEAGTRLIQTIMGLGLAAWVLEPCIMLHHA